MVVALAIVSISAVFICRHKSSLGPRIKSVRFRVLARALCHEIRPNSMFKLEKCLENRISHSLLLPKCTIHV